MASEKSKNIILPALFAAFTAVGAFIKIPLPFVPITLQVLFVAFSGILLGPSRGMLSQIIYVCTGLAGVPIFTRGGGISYVLQPTFGYLLGFIFAAFIIGAISRKLGRYNFKNIFISILCGIIVIYSIGLPYLYFINKLYLGSPKTIKWVFYYGFAASIPGDIISAVIVSLLAQKIIPRIKNFI